MKPADKVQIQDVLQEWRARTLDTLLAMLAVAALPAWGMTVYIAFQSPDYRIQALFFSFLLAVGIALGVLRYGQGTSCFAVLFLGWTAALNDYLWGKCEIQETAHDVTPSLGLSGSGKVFLVPSSLRAGEIARVLRDGYSVETLNDGFRSLVRTLHLDVLIIDTHPGLNEETLLSLAMSNILIIVMRPDQQDYLGTGVTVEVARKLRVPNLMLIVNKVPAAFSPEEVRQRVEHAYKAPVAAILPHSDEIMTLASTGIFVLRYPDHPITESLKQVVRML